MAQGRKQKAKLEARQRGYTKTIASDSSRSTQFTKPGSNKKSH